MSISTEQAQATLRLSEVASPTQKQVLEAFTRLARRYPAASFPERFRELIQARDTLLDPARDLRSLFTARHIDISWLATLLPRQPDATDPSWHEQRGLLLAMLKAAFTGIDELTPSANALEADHDFNPAEDDLVREMLKTLKPHEIEQLIDLLDR